MERNLPRRRLLHDETTRIVIGAFYDVYNALGFGFLEKVYVNALVVALERAGLLVERERLFEVPFRDAVVGLYRVDLLVERCVVVEAKSTSYLTEADFKQTLNCLTCTKLDVSLLLHFGPKPRFHRIVAEELNKAGREGSRLKSEGGRTSNK
jgi:GxxExxY protein